LSLLLGAWSGLGLICLQSPLERRRFGFPPQQLAPRVITLLAACAQLTLSLSAAVQHHGIGFGMILWVSLVGLLGLMLALMLPYAAHGVINSAIAIAAIMLTLAVF
jgi:FtsH-binding integral membrane protein